MILEGENLRLQNTVKRWLPCPLFADISQIVVRDEARHLAFETRYLKATLPIMSVTERRAIGVWLKSLWDTTFDDVSDRLAHPKCIAGPLGIAAWRHGAWAERCDTLRKIGLFGNFEPAAFFGTD